MDTFTAAPHHDVLELAETRFDLIILGTDLRASSSRVFLGPRVEAVLDRATCPVIIVNVS